MEYAGDRKKRVRRIIRTLGKAYPDVRLALDYTTPLDLLISLILAAQCTDVRVNQVMAGLRPKYTRAKDWADLDRGVLEDEIRSTGFFRNKAKAIQECTRALVERFEGAVPESLVI